MNEFSKFTEYSVEKYRSRSFKAAKIIFPIITIVFSLFTGFIITLYEPLLGILLSIVIAVASMCYWAHLFRTVHYDYRISNGELHFAVVYNKRKRKEMGFLTISKLEVIAPYRGIYKEHADNTQYENIFDFSSSFDSPDLYYAVEVDEDDSTRSIYFFEPSAKMLKLLCYHNRQTVSVKLENE